jgi:hypothetical protein
MQSAADEPASECGVLLDAKGNAFMLITLQSFRIERVDADRCNPYLMVGHRARVYLGVTAPGRTMG